MNRLMKVAAWALVGVLMPLCSYGQSIDGVYVDRDGTSHRWSINEAHTLIWNGRPYIPVGGMFCPKYFVEGQTEENWESDVRDLALLKSKGILDIYINPVFGATNIPADAWQKLIDHLEKEGFYYGVELTDGPQKPLAGWIIRPNVYRYPDIHEDKIVTLKAENSLGGIWATADSMGNIVSTGSLQMQDNEALIQVRGRDESRRILLAYPVKTVDSGPEGLQNFWEGYSEYRDRLLAHFKDVKFGPGLRFWVDPFINEMGIRGEAEYLIPVSQAYQLELEAWLRRHYPDMGSLRRSWALPNEVTSFEQASLLIPLWRGERGLPYVFNTRTGDTEKLTSMHSRMWDDLLRFRHDSIRGYLNDISIALKRGVANVPVVVKWTANYDFFINDNRMGFDGIGVEAYGPPSVIGPFAGAQCLSLVKQSSRPMWLLTTEMQTTAGEDKEGVGFASEDELVACLSALRDTGSKGFYIFGFRLSPPWANFDLLRVPEQIDWLRGFRDRLNADVLLTEWAPRGVWFSAENPLGADLTRLEQDLWWLPRKIRAEQVPIREGVRAYAIPEGDGLAVYIWSPGGNQELEIKLPQGVEPSIHFTGIDERQARQHRDTLTIPLTRNPAIVRGLSTTIFHSADSLVDQVEYLTRLIARGEAMDMLVGEYRIALDNAKTMIKGDMLGIAGSTLGRAILELETLVTPFYWAYGQDASETSFDGTGYHPDASGTRYLRIDTAIEPPFQPYTASYPFAVVMEGDYEVWVAGSRLDDTGTSPISWNYGETSWISASDRQPTGRSYGPGFYWTRIGTVRLQQGQQVVRFRLDDRAANGKYVMSIDSVVLAREPFAPDGARKPQIQ